MTHKKVHSTKWASGIFSISFDFADRFFVICYLSMSVIQMPQQASQCTIARVIFHICSTRCILEPSVSSVRCQISRKGRMCTYVDLYTHPLMDGLISTYWYFSGLSDSETRTPYGCTFQFLLVLFGTYRF